ncbi:MAG: helix-turn-helix transcriptional regulator [Gemmatimonadota bacterium]
MSDDLVGRLRPHWFHILSALAREDLHGSGIARDVEEQTEGQVHLWPATLYRTLDELVEEGLIERLSSSQAPEGESARRQYYRLTAAGRAALAAAVDRMAAWVGTARRRLREV